MVLALTRKKAAGGSGVGTAAVQLPVKSTVTRSKCRRVGLGLLAEAICV